MLVHVKQWFGTRVCAFALVSLGAGRGTIA